MPHKTGTLKQKNKPFKGSSKHKAESKNFGVPSPSYHIFLSFSSFPTHPKKSPNWINQ